jgi:hypothetical protein
MDRVMRIEYAFSGQACHFSREFPPGLGRIGIPESIIRGWGLPSLAGRAARGGRVAARTGGPPRRRRRCSPRGTAGELIYLPNSPDKQSQLRSFGIEVRNVVSTEVYATAANVRYLRAEVSQPRHTSTLPIAR